MSMKSQTQVPAGTDEIADLLGSVAAMAADFLNENEAGQVPVRKPLSPAQIRQRLPIDPPRQGRPLTAVLDDLRQVLAASVRTTHPRFANQLFVGADLPGIIGEWITAILDTTMATYEMAPVATVMERDLIGKMCDLAGFDDGEGILAPGGSISNLMALMAARDWAYPRARVSGMSGSPPPALFTSTEAHYSLKRAANILGLGIDSVYGVDIDDTARMRPESLREQIAKARQDGRRPFFVCATAGTTVAGAYDPIAAVADICDDEDLWLHVDGAYGGAVLLSKTYRHLIDGVSRADSMTWCPHKMMGLPLVGSALLMRRCGQLRKSLAIKADYIFHEQEDQPADLGLISLQCGRRIDSLKLWMAWQSRGDEGFEEMVDGFFALRKRFAELIEERPHFELVRQPEGLNVLFDYIPPALRDMPAGEARRQALDEATRKIREAVNDRGKVMINYGPVDDYATFRMVHINPRMRADDLPIFLDEIQTVGDTLYAD